MGLTTQTQIEKARWQNIIYDVIMSRLWFESFVSVGKNYDQPWRARFLHIYFY